MKNKLNDELGETIRESQDATWSELTTFEREDVLETAGFIVDIYRAIGNKKGSFKRKRSNNAGAAESAQAANSMHEGLRKSLGY